jgi:hypothetical protein
MACRNLHRSDVLNSAQVLALLTSRAVLRTSVSDIVFEQAGTRT